MCNCVICSCKSANKPYLQQRTYKESISTAIFFFSSLYFIISLISCNLSEYLYFYKISCRKVKISISSRGGNFQFSARGERYVYLKKNSPRVNFTSPTCNMPLSLFFYVSRQIWLEIQKSLFA